MNTQQVKISLYVENNLFNFEELTLASLRSSYLVDKSLKLILTNAFIMHIWHWTNKLMIIYLKQLYRHIKNEQQRVATTRQITHVFGQKHFKPNKNGVSVFSLVRNAEEFIKDFVEYYQSLGVDHIIIVDNQSTDNTVSILKTFKDVSVFTTPLDFLSNEAIIRRHFLKTHLKKRWVLSVDSDELFQFPYQKNRTLSTFIQYLNDQKVNCVTALMLDMFAKDYSNIETPSLRQAYPYCEPSSIEREQYLDNSYLTRGNKVPPELSSYKNGIRTRLSPADKSFLLLKHCLMFIDENIIPFSHPHYAANATLSNITCVLLHYKFTRGFVQRAQGTLTTIDHDSIWGQELRATIDIINNQESSLFHPNRSVKFTSVEDLEKNSLISLPRKFKAEMA